MNSNKTKPLRIYFISIALFLSFPNLFAQKEKIDSFILTVTIPSKIMNIEHKAMVFLPKTYYVSKDSFPVVYLLHGYTGYYNNWYEREPKLPEYCTHYNFIIVTPEGTSNSWYIDSPIDTVSKYETYIAQEVPGWIDDHFKTFRNKNKRAICGLSMGGHGALTIAVDHNNIFGAAGSMSGVLDFIPFKNQWNLSLKLGSYKKHNENWEKFSFSGKIEGLNHNNIPAFFIDCGIDDKFYNVNVNTHKRLLKKNIPHDFIVRPGGHSWQYWKNALPYHLLFFHNYFINGY